jgi:hypothetical protein
VFLTAVEQIPITQPEDVWRVFDDAVEAGYAALAALVLRA